MSCLESLLIISIAFFSLSKFNTILRSYLEQGNTQILYQGLLEYTFFFLCDSYYLFFVIEMPVVFCNRRKNKKKYIKYYRNPQNWLVDVCFFFKKLMMMCVLTQIFFRLQISMMRYFIEKFRSYQKF